MPDLREQLQQCFQGRVCLMGLGNVDYGDDGFGVRLAEALQSEARPMPERDRCRHARPSARSVGRVESADFDHLIFLDAVEFGGAPGSVVLLDADEWPIRFPQIWFPQISTHKISLGLLAEVGRGERNDQSVAAGRPAGVAQAGARLTPAVRDHARMLLELLSDASVRPLNPPCRPAIRRRCMTPEQAVIAAILICIAGAVLTLLVSRNRTARRLARLPGHRGHRGPDLSRGRPRAHAGPSPQPAGVLRSCRRSGWRCASTWTA